MGLDFKDQFSEIHMGEEVLLLTDLLNFSQDIEQSLILQGLSQSLTLPSIKHVISIRLTPISEGVTA